MRDGIFTEIKSVSNASHWRECGRFIIPLSIVELASSKKVDSSRR